ncbi:DNA-binding LacI/PurR family transcriptional regulator [Arthrobacter silviterrae]|uniref:LacI family transcriptional regulator n=1 Tax=Arthrobacter silviterrae TaxID=2026658 RepID=A0ABX0DG70_9MICC|nr:MULTISPECIES: LacI family DNA-binding transcriptional regulator [Arthrobacter]MCU6480282.1 LacI family transcriptional regulator [Arthrobacter sp. A2-55]MDQ0278901.1 DNA-binding LacI/PurR family transcriptional regulator [Arthrobacter silviterrae]NGN85561.1 LacI family transcriptional regulator [Arthrobacter silviterrae]
MSRPTMRQIAQVTGLSEAAVSFALNGKGGVSPATVTRVHEAAEKLGWRRNVAAAALSGARAGAVGLVLARGRDGLGNDSFFLRLIAGIESVINAESQALVLQIVETLEQEQETYQRWWSERRVDGVFVVDPRTTDTRPQQLKGLGLPAVAIGGTPGFGLPFVGVDDAAAMTVLVQHLAGQGHTDIAHVAGINDLLHTRRRVEAFAAAAKKLGIRAHGSYLTDYSEHSGLEATEEILALPERPTAIIYDNEVLALAGLATFNAHRLDVPQDMAVVAWEDNIIWTAIRPQLTALRRDPTVMGAEAARSLLELMAGTTPEDVQMPTPQLVVRDSTVEGAGR